MPGSDKAPRGKERRWLEMRAVFAWAVGSWLRPAGAVASWEQKPGRWELAREDSSDEQTRAPQSGAGHEPDREGAVQVQGTGT
ncbi:MAG: hypothetical protein IVW55_17415 [Chloroflexi bacterium]|nr:hypothetical protein [Chloroflexota bacterium]